LRRTNPAADQGPTRPFRVSLVGRDRELAVLTTGLEDALAGRGHLYLVGGEPGVGKTRLLEEVAAMAAARNAAVIWGRCWEREGAPPFWPWERVLGALLQQAEGAAASAADADLAGQIARLVPIHRFRPDGVPPGGVAIESSHVPAAAPESGLQRFALLDAIATFFERVAARLPLVLLLDDLHAAQLQALLLLEFVARDLHSVPLLLVAAYREAEPALGALSERLGELARRSTAIPLRGLDADGTRALATAVAGLQPSDELACLLHETTGGNPFFVDETVRLLLADERFDDPSVVRQGLGVPDRVRSAVQARLAPLPKNSREVLRAAAVVGQEFDQELLAAVLNISSAAVSAALAIPVAKGFVRLLALGELRFAHALTRETLYDEIPAAQRIHLHCLIGTALAARYGDRRDVDCSSVAHHFLKGQPEADALRALAFIRRAGDAAMGLCAYESAAAHFEEGLALLDSGVRAPLTERPELLIALGRAWSRAGDPERAKRAIDRALSAARAVDSMTLLAEAALTIRVDADGSTPDLERIHYLEEALERLGTDDSTLRARVLAHLASELYYTGDVARRDALSQLALAVARRLADPVTLACALAGRCFAVWGLGPDEDRLPLAAELLDLARTLGDPELALEAHRWRVMDFLSLGDLVAVDREIGAATQLAAQLRQPYYRWFCGTWRSMRAALAGRFADAERLAQVAYESSAGTQPLNTAISLAGQIHVLSWMKGEFERLVPAYQAYCEHYQTLYPEIRHSLARVLAGANRFEEARRELEPLAMDGFGAVRNAVGGQQLTSLAMLAETCVALADVPRCEQLYRLMRPAAGRVIVLGIALGTCGPVDRYLGLLASVCGDWRAAEGHFARSLELSMRLESPPFIAMTQQDLAAMLVARGRAEDQTNAAALAGTALELAERLGMRGVAEQARALRTRLDGTPAAMPPAAVACDGNAYTREGEYWTVTYNGVACRLRDRAGFTYLAALLERPHEELPALILTNGSKTPSSANTQGAKLLRGRSPADPTDMRDERVRDEYRERLQDLAEEIEAAERDNDTGRVEYLRTESERLRGALAAVLGFGRRARRASAPGERARVRVTRALREAINRIAAVHADLGAHLSRSVRTGTYCCYTPSEPTLWQVGRDRS